MAKITRQVKPTKKFTNYREYKPFLRVEFLYACVYCEVYESESAGEDNFQVEHYVPQSKYPMLECVYENLFYSCAFCNGPAAKSGYWATKEQREKGHYVLNPCRHDIDIHIDKSSSKWKGLTPEGRWNVRRFYLDSKNLQFIRDRRQQAPLASAQSNAANIMTILQGFEKHLTPQEIADLSRIQRVLSAISVQHRRLDSRRA